MITRCEETYLRKKAQKITDDMHPHEKFAIQRFEENLTRPGGGGGGGQKALFSFHHCLGRKNR